MKIGLFVGSFNPITLAHENIVRDLLKNKIIDYVYFLPVNSKKSDLISIDKRIDMIKLLNIKETETLNIYDYENSGLFNYNVLNSIDKKITHIIMGSDLFLKFKTFANWNTILEKYYIVVIKRDFDIINYIEKNYNDYKKRIVIVNQNYAGSSLKAKEALKKHYNIYLNSKVLDYIGKNNLYN